MMVAGLVLVALSQVPVGASAPAPGEQGTVHLDGSRLPPPLRDDVLAHLGAELQLWRLGVTSEPGQALSLELDPTPVGVEITARADGEAAQRRVELTEVPPDARALVTAIAAVELLRGVRSRAFARRAAPPEPSRWFAGLGVRGDRFSAGHWQGGAEASVGWRVAPRWALVGTVGQRWSPGRPTSLGPLSARGATFALELEASPSGLKDLLRVQLGVEALRLTYFGPFLAASPTRGTAVLTRAGLLAALPLAGAFDLLIGATLSVPVRSLVVSDGPSPVSGVSGVGLSASAGVRVRL